MKRKHNEITGLNSLPPLNENEIASTKQKIRAIIQETEANLQQLKHSQDQERYRLQRQLQDAEIIFQDPEKIEAISYEIKVFEFTSSHKILSCQKELDRLTAALDSPEEAADLFSGPLATDESAGPIINAFLESLCDNIPNPMDDSTSSEADTDSTMDGKQQPPTKKHKPLGAAAKTTVVFSHRPTQQPARPTSTEGDLENTMLDTIPTTKAG